MLFRSWASRLCVCTVYLLAGVFEGAAFGADNNTPLWLRDSVLQTTRIEVDVSAAALDCLLLVEDSAGSATGEAVSGGDASRSYLSLHRKIDRKSQTSRTLGVAVEMASLAGRFAKLGSVHVQGFYRTEIYVSAGLKALVVKHTPFAGLQTFLDTTAAEGTDDASGTSLSTWTVFNNVEDYLSENYRGNYSGWFSAVTVDSPSSPNAVHQSPTHWTRLMATPSAPDIHDFSCSSPHSAGLPASASHSTIPFKTLAPYVKKQCNSASELLNRWELKQQIRAPGAFDWLMDALCHFDLEFTLHHQPLAGGDRSVTQNRALTIGAILSRIHQLSYEHTLASVIGFQALQLKVGAPVRGRKGVIWPPVPHEKVLQDAVEVLVDTMYMAHLFQEVLGCLDWLLDLDNVVDVRLGDQWVNRVLLLRALSEFHVGNLGAAAMDLAVLTPRVPEDFMVPFVLKGIVEMIEAASSTHHHHHHHRSALSEANRTFVDQVLMLAEAQHASLTSRCHMNYAGFRIPYPGAPAKDDDLSDYELRHRHNGNSSISTTEIETSIHEEPSLAHDVERFRRDRGWPKKTSWTPDRLDHVPTRAEFEKYAAARQPFILSVPGRGPHNDDHQTTANHCSSTMQAMGWDRVCQWDSEYLCDQIPDAKVWLHSPVNRTLDGAPQFGVTWKPTNRQFESFCSFARECFNARPPPSWTNGIDDVCLSSQCASGKEPASDRYFDLGSTVSHQKFRFPLDRLRSDFPFPAFLELRDIKMVAMWMGASPTDKPSNSGLHFDNMDNFHVVTHGAKHWKIFSPFDAPRLGYIHPPAEVTDMGFVLDVDDFRSKQHSLSNGKAATPASPPPSKSILSSWQRRGFIGRFSRRGRVYSNITGGGGGGGGGDFDFRDAVVAEFTIRDGEALYLPGGWAHEVESSGTHIGLTFWTPPPRGQMNALPKFAPRSELKGRGQSNPPKSRKEQIRQRKQQARK